MAPSTYREYAPRAELRPWLVCAWTLETGPGTESHRQLVLPDGCSDILWVGDSPPIVVGPMTRASRAVMTPGTSLVGLRFRPGMATAILGATSGEFTDRHVPLEDLWERRATREAGERVAEAATAEARADLVQELLARRRERFDAPDPVIRHAVRLLADPERRIGTLAGEVGVSARQLHRRFRRAVGYGPKLFQRILRFQRLLALAQTPAAAGLGRLAIRAGYADQAHMTREVGELSGTRPSQLLGRAATALAGSGLLPTSG